jgi:hypothetical protein
MRTNKEIKTEIAALKALKPIGPFKAKTAQSIELAIDELEFGYDDTADEWNELTDEQQNIINSTRRWKEGGSDEKTSEGCGSLVA